MAKKRRESAPPAYEKVVRKAELVRKLEDLYDGKEPTFRHVEIMFILDETRKMRDDYERALEELDNHIELLENLAQTLSDKVDNRIAQLEATAAELEATVAHWKQKYEEKVVELAQLRPQPPPSDRIVLDMVDMVDEEPRNPRAAIETHIYLFKDHPGCSQMPADLVMNVSMFCGLRTETSLAAASKRLTKTEKNVRKWRFLLKVCYPDMFASTKDKTALRINHARKIFGCSCIPLFIDSPKLLEVMDNGNDRSELRKWYKETDLKMKRFSPYWTLFVHSIRNDKPDTVRWLIPVLSGAYERAHSTIAPRELQIEADALARRTVRAEKCVVQSLIHLSARQIRPSDYSMLPDHLQLLVDDKW